MDRNLVDLHTHSTASDGTDAPAALAARAREQNLAAFALTDHDTLDGLDEACACGQELGIRVIRGCEISTRCETGEFHILGLWIPERDEALRAWLTDIRQRRNERNAEMVARLRALGYDISIEEVRALARGSVGRPHIAAALAARGYVPDAESAFRDLLGANGKAYVPKRVPPPEEAVRVLADIGAMPALAHPFIHKNFDNAWLEEFVRRLARNGLRAIEAWHSAHSEDDTRRSVELAHRFGLGLSGGSDYHGDNKPGIRLGVGYGSLRIPLEALERLEQHRNRLTGRAC